MKTMMKFLVSSISVGAILITFSITLKNNTLESLRSNAKQLPTGCKCVMATNDCINSGTGSIYVGYRVVCN